MTCNQNKQFYKIKRNKTKTKQLRDFGLLYFWSTIEIVNIHKNRRILN